MPVQQKPPKFAVKNQPAHPLKSFQSTQVVSSNIDDYNM